jgi:hypothetical protein
MQIEYEINFPELIDKIEDLWFTQSNLTVSFSSLNAFYSEPLDKISTDENRSVILLNDRLLLTTPKSPRIAVVIEVENALSLQFAMYDLEKNPCSTCKEDYDVLPDYRVTIARE